MRLFALAPWPLLSEKTQDMALPDHVVLRGPEIGLVMLRGRIGASGNAFNCGEATVTRCSVKLTSGAEGHSYILGRNGEHAKRAAICDAIFQDKPEDLQDLLKTLDSELRSARLSGASKAAATKVDFFTMVRGDD